MTAQPCPSGSFAKSGTNSSSACSLASLVTFSIALPISKERFNAEAQSNFIKAISLTTSVLPENIVVQTINEQRRAASSSIFIVSQLAIKDLSTASVVAAKLNSDEINRNLVLEGLPKGTVISVVTSSPPAPDDASQSSIIIGAVLGSAVFVLIVAAVIWLRRVESEEERVLRTAMNDLRVRLKISPSYSVLLSTETSITSYFTAARFPWSSARKEIIIVQKGYLEAAARLALMQVLLFKAVSSAGTLYAEWHFCCSGI